MALTGLLLAAAALLAGLELRRRRRLRLRRDPALRRRHLALARPAVIVLLVGLLGGPLSSWWLRGWTPFERLHGWVGLCAAALFAATGWLGLRLERGRGRPVEAHAALGTLAVLVGALALATGFVLLP